MTTQETASLFVKVVVSSDGLLPTPNEMATLLSEQWDQTSSIPGLDILECEASGDWDGNIDTSLWDDNHIQFARLIAELEAGGVFNGPVVNAVSQEMDLLPSEFMYLVERAQSTWDKAKANL